jgi:hypothetical protein
MRHRLLLLSLMPGYALSAISAELPQGIRHGTVEE